MEKDKKFIETYQIEDYEILSEYGWTPVSAIGKTVQYQIWLLKTEHHELKCADNHIVFDKNGEQIFVKDLKIGDKIKTENGLEEVVICKPTEEFDNMYDVQVDSVSHSYFTNGILSHNSTMYCIYALWYTTFFPEKKVLILANKAPTALELMGRISMAYTYLPYWLKCAVTDFNKSLLKFTNLSSIQAFTSSSSAARGFSGSCVDENTKIEVRLKYLPFIRFKIKMKTLEKIFDFFNLSNQSK